LFTAPLRTQVLAYRLFSASSLEPKADFLAVLKLREDRKVTTPLSSRGEGAIYDLDMVPQSGA